MDYFLTDEQKELKGLLGAFMKNEVKPHLMELDECGEFPVELYKKAFDLGFHCLSIPEAYGGSGLDHVTMGVLLEEIGYTDPGFAITILCTALALKCVLIGGNEEQKQRACNIILPGSFGAFCLTEPSCGSDSANLRTTYRIEGDTVVLNGSKCFVTNGQEAGLFIVFATRDRALGPKGISAFMLERGTPGLSVGKHENKMGLRLSNTCDVALEEVRIPLTDMLGQEGTGMHIALAGLDEGRLNNAAIAAGICQAALDAAVDYAKIRVSFGKPLIELQAIQMMLSDMAIQTEAARLLVRNGMTLVDAGVKAGKEASMAKAFCGDAAVKVTTDAVQVFGGYGYSKEYPVEKMMRDAKIFQIFEGTNQIQRLVILVPFPQLCGPVSAPYIVSVMARYKEQGREGMDNLWSGIGSLTIVAVIFMLFPVSMDLSAPASFCVMGVLVLIQGYTCTQVGIKLCRDQMDIGIAGMMTGVMAVKGGAWSMAVGIIFYLFLTTKDKIVNDYRLTRKEQDEEDARLAAKSQMSYEVVDNN